MEHEEDNSLFFLDCHLPSDDRLKLTATYTDTYLHLSYHQPTHAKRGVIKRLHDRTRMVTTNEQKDMFW